MYNISDQAVTNAEKNLESKSINGSFGAVLTDDEFRIVCDFSGYEVLLSFPLL